MAEIRGRVFFCHRRRLCTQASHKHTVIHPPTASSTPTSLLFPGSLQLAPGVLSATLALGVVTSCCERPQRWRQKWRKTLHNDPTVYIEHTHSHSLPLTHTHTRTQTLWSAVLFLSRSLRECGQTPLVTGLQNRSTLVSRRFITLNLSASFSCLSSPFCSFFPFFLFVFFSPCAKRPTKLCFLRLTSLPF